MPEKAETSAVIRIAESVGSLTAEEWGTLCGTSRRGPGRYNPFLSRSFLTSLEDSGCVAARTGWHGHHLRLESSEGELLGAVPCYLKSHSQGEYVFDHGWADALERAGGDYYPKLQCSVPFTPATGPRLLVPNGQDQRRSLLAAGLRAVTEKLDISSAHVTFALEDDMQALQEAGFLRRIDQQFHFFNEGFESYDDFLATLASRKRKALKKERREALAAGITVEKLTGASITEEAWDAFFAFYSDTGSRKWGRPYLNRRFFSLAGERMADDILLVMAKRAGRYVAGAINFIGADTLFGRNWGCIEHHPFLHFEVCYHQAIDFAIERGLKVVEAGAQGEHKLARGYRPVETLSAHYLTHPSLRKAVADYLKQERQQVAMASAYYDEHAPFRKNSEERDDDGL